MKLTNDIFNQETRQALKKLSTFGKIRDMKLFMSIAKLQNEYDKASQVFDFAHTQLINEYCDKDKSGNPIISSAGANIISKRKSDFIKVQKDLIDQEIDLNVDKISVNLEENDLLSVLSPADVSTLFDLINFRMDGE